MSMKHVYNLSSSSSEDEGSDEDNVNPVLPNIERKNPVVSAPSVNKNVADGDGSVSDEDSDNDLDVQWEDGASLHSENERNEDSEPFSESAEALARASKVINMPLRAVTVDFDDSNDPQTTDTQNTDTKQTKKKSRRVIKLTNLPENVSILLLDLQRSHLLCSASRAVLLSRVCSDATLSNVCLSLIPASLIDATSFGMPTETQVRDFCEWFFDFVHNVLERRRVARQRHVSSGAPTLRRRKRKRAEVVDKSRELIEGAGCTRPERLMTILHSLSPTYDENPLLWSHFSDGKNNEKDTDDLESLVGSITPHEKAQLMIALGRSLGWRVRYVCALQPTSTELTVHHPLLASSISNIFHTIGRRIDSTSSGKLTMTKKAKKIKGAGNADSPKNKLSAGNINSPTCDSLAWVEFQCCEPAVGKKSAKKRRRPPPQSSNTTATSEATVARWVHVDVERRLFHQPLEVENVLSLLRSRQEQREDDGSSSNTSSGTRVGKRSGGERRISKGRNGANARRAKVLVSFVLAVEHPYAYDDAKRRARPLDDNDDDEPSARLTDVTPRYASAWSRTLLLRGAPSKKSIVESKGRCPNVWWKETLRSINQFYKQRERERRTREGANRSRVTQDDCSFSAKKCGRVTKMEVPVTDSNTNDSSNCEKTSSSFSKVDRPKKTKLVDVVSLVEDDDQNNHGLNGEDDDDDDSLSSSERNELSRTRTNEPIPTSKTAFNNHPVYALPSLLNQNEVLRPGAVFCGMFKGEFVYRRDDSVDVARPARAWLRLRRRVKDSELENPVRVLKARKVGKKAGGFKALTDYGVGDAADDGGEESRARQLERQRANDERQTRRDEESRRLYGKWQTERWTPPYVLPHEDIPVNEYGNVEKDLINPGLSHLTEHRVASVAKRLGIPYAPCLVGFDHSSGNGSTPTIRGIVVHEHNVELLREAQEAWESQLVETETTKREMEVFERWRTLIQGVVTKDRLDREYGDGC